LKAVALLSLNVQTVSKMYFLKTIDIVYTFGAFHFVTFFHSLYQYNQWSEMPWKDLAMTYYALTVLQDVKPYLHPLSALIIDHTMIAGIASREAGQTSLVTYGRCRQRCQSKKFSSFYREEMEWRRKQEKKQKLQQVTRLVGLQLLHCKAVLLGCTNADCCS